MSKRIVKLPLTPIASYAEARRAARKLLGESAELRTKYDAPTQKFHVGVRLKGIFTVAGAGNNWAEALNDAEQRIQAKGVMHPGCSYLAAACCNKCGWINPNWRE